jgi:hypothetical protein
MLALILLTSHSYLLRLILHLSKLRKDKERLQIFQVVVRSSQWDGTKAINSTCENCKEVVVSLSV